MITLEIRATAADLRPDRIHRILRAHDRGKDQHLIVNMLDLTRIRNDPHPLFKSIRSRLSA